MTLSSFDQAKTHFGKARAGDLAAMAAGKGGLINPILPEFIGKMDPQFVDIYTKYQAPRARADQVSIEEYRANPSKYTFPIAEGPKPAVGDVSIYKIPVDRPLGEIQVAVYLPTEDAIAKGGLKSSAGLPAHVNYHGGGWVIGSLLTNESWCRQACQALGAVIVDVDYRLAPEYPFPTQVWDSWSALKWVFANASTFGINPSSISIGGMSAGGHLTAVLAILARDEESMPSLKLQLLVAPATDARFMPIEGSCDPNVVPYETYISCENAPCLPLQRMKWFHNLWLGKDAEKRKASSNSWMASPMLADSHAGLAPALVCCAEFDVLRSEGEAYHRKLQAAGTDSAYIMYEGVCHTWCMWEGELDKGKKFVSDAFAALRKAHTVDP